MIDMPLMQRQLMKMLLPTEAARTMFMQIALLLPQADAGDEQAARCVRILTPLIKFRACRDARRVTGDAMEVRGGTGYIEEWSDARLVRDAHLGSIWEGTSNIVALDVARAARREQALDALRTFLGDRLGAAPLPDASRAALRRILARACDGLARVAADGDDARVRQAASALYYASAAVLMACEGAQLAPDYRRLALAHLLVRHKLLPVDPLAPASRDDEAAAFDALLRGAPVSLDVALDLLPEVER
ncbi:putative acyl-CoA dehydrogenase AidB [Burkholderia multivorans]|nr:acyl-CoA dehydrogenase family protein [Burkholderia multivorans]MDR8875009.1 putative acyl-CoA dehydrogenase AidB [Burkholderia multivorans]MDR8881651.1 putative acyl-CoA dehydrogenase AidB [Burkholderia multivorans]MDR8888396.1 putative acyl-CoA dehydrogenase AidB [Burkholderia multivorans]MDR8893006.1 putative acyl-CoA dehydrogenase AidB [Burkholderia multivorans]MDR8900057.1 putative acyl-CoA dehydrogenase AidB [Burkholderia multivorans]